jgi:holo-[acyl-carrier protein] synthase
MIKGIGVDLIEVDRIAKLIEKSPRFLQRVFTPAEIAYCSKKKNGPQNFAARFAAKEAFFKALGRRVPWKDVEVLNLTSGRPKLSLGTERKWPFKKAHLTLSHLADYALAVVILED